jgi:asparagine synthase (glutamine-hydrolysing)
MCGIAGIVGPGVGGGADHGMPAMLATLARRGPDDHGCVAYRNCVLGHTRLAILDLSTGQQPMRDDAADLTITFNGEIYNFRELRAELEAVGHVFRTRSDTEVILKAYLQFGASCVERIDGMFAFAIWDAAADTLFLARDRFGKKPLYYAFDSAATLLFGSEIKTLLASGKIQPLLDPAAIDGYLRLSYVPPDRSVYRNIFVLPPGHAATFTGGRMRTWRYWTLRYAPLRIGYEEAKREVRRLLKEAVTRRMVADVEVGALLSGGVDSTIVTQWAQESATRAIKTFSVGYGSHINELPHAQAAADRFGTDHHVLQVGDATLPDELGCVAAYFDEPHADSSNVAQSLVSRLAQSRVKVALSGDGGDELFLGYDWYWWHWGQGRRARLKQALFSSLLRDHVRSRQVFRAADRARLWGDGVPGGDLVPDDVRRARLRGVPAVNFFDLTVYLPGQLLVKADRAGMMHSLEVRSPLLDTALAEFVFSLPTEFKTDRVSGKVILRDLLREVMPAAFVDRAKQGFGAPVAAWLRTICKDLVHDTLGTRDARIYGGLSREVVHGMLRRFYSGEDETSYHRIWVLLCLELWFRSHRPGD